MSDFPAKAREQARRIAALMGDHRPRFEDEVREWEKGAAKQLEEEKGHQLRLHNHLQKVLEASRLRDKKAGPPAEGWEWQVNPLVHQREKKQYRTLVGAWVPPDLAKPPDSRLPIIVTDRPLTLREKFAVLVAIHGVMVQKLSDSEEEGRLPTLMGAVFIKKDSAAFWDEVALWVDDIEHVLPPSPPRAEVNEACFPAVSAALPRRDVPSIPLPKQDIEILRFLEKQSTTMFQVDIEAATFISRRIVGKRLEGLRKQGFVHRPAGEREGDAITDKGRALLKGMPPSSD